METLIELGAERGAPEPDRPAPPVAGRGWRVAALLLVCALLAGAAPPARLATLSGPVLPERAVLLGAGPLLLVADPGAAPPTLSAYDPAAPERARWRVDLPPAAGWSAEPAGDLVLVTERDPVRRVVATTARTARTGERRWRRPDRVYAAGDGAVAVTEVRSVADPGRRIEGAVHGVDPATGATRWTVALPSTAVLTVLPGAPARVLVLRDDGVARVYDVGDGTVRGEGRLPPADYAPDNPQVVGDRLVLRHPTARGAELIGYDLPALTVRWRVPLADGDVTIRGCAGLLCGQDARDRWALTPATGDRAWTWSGGAQWRAVPGGRGGPQVLLRAAQDGRRNLVATVGRDGPRVAGVLPTGTRDCRAVSGALACRDSAGRLTVWPGRPAAGT
ncbi:PQQ-binding-like beta-propeller repeat protein [Micromonospora sp. WMMD812]|uniref:outer membrane protein assembly factor BamB family protein n=1 Tax=Micromonospora sp. WMMD812 TaxID=3015152 RepID=UPI00248BA0C7|nr:PQQ-binding-like beta-propeller repeat protein [Micromonospora sp. WMMD812]WBB68730.1 hypothetical protein O7603_04985 [Micromonospora sp. WMMD812]